MVNSPCIGVCAVEDGRCTACDRTLADIAAWSSMTPKERMERMQAIQDAAED